MKRIMHSLIVPHVIGALVATIFVWTIASWIGASYAQRFYHSTLDAASVVARDALGDADPARVRSELLRLEPSFSQWSITAAAFDRSGRFLEGDASLSADGLLAGNEPVDQLGRQMAIVPTRDGYVLLVPQPAAVNAIRWSVAGWLVLTLAIVATVAYFYGGVWARERARSIARLRDGLRAVAEGEPTLASQDDPLYGEVWAAAAAAVRRLGGEAAARAEGEERLRAFLADAGHELRTPLAIAVGYLGILKRGAVEDRALTERIIGDVGIEHERLARLVERILHLARLDALPMNPDAVADVTQVAQEAIALVRPLAPEREIAFQAAPGAYAAIADDDLRDALRNVLDNALRYAPEAGVGVTIVSRDRDVVIRIADGGPGMDGFTASHAFDRFFRGPDRGSVPGSGLGLAIVRRVVERAHGSVDLRSARGEGTVVELRVPAAREADQHGPLPANAAALN